VTVAWFPARYPGAVTRGVVVAARGWRRWVTVRDYRQAAEQAEKLADKFTEIWALTLFCWKVTGAALVAAPVIGSVAELVYGSVAPWLGAAVLSVALAVLGRRKDGSPGRKAVLAGPRSLTWTMDPQVLVDAFRDGHPTQGGGPQHIDHLGDLRPDLAAVACPFGEVIAQGARQAGPQTWPGRNAPPVVITAAGGWSEPSGWTRRSSSTRLRSGAMQTAAFVIAVIAVVLSALSLGWQAAVFALTGGRVRVTLHVGALDQMGTSMVTLPVEQLSGQRAQGLADQGFTRPVFAVRVRNVGRLPVTVERWSLRVPDDPGRRGGFLVPSSVPNPAGGAELMPMGNLSIGPALPHRLEAGASETWAVSIDAVQAFAAASKETFGLAAFSIVGKVELGDGRTRTSSAALQV